MTDNGRHAEITTAQKRLISHMLAGHTVESAATKAQISHRTAWRYLAEPAVRAELQRRGDALLAGATSGLLADLALARKTLREVMNDQDAPPTARVSAARAVLDSVLRLVEMYALVGRVKLLEEAYMKNEEASNEH